MLASKIPTFANNFKTMDHTKNPCPTEKGKEKPKTHWTETLKSRPRGTKCYRSKR